MAKNIICKECGKERDHMARGLCGRCYKRLWTRKRFGHSPRIDRTTNGVFVCSVCGKQTKHEAKGLCRTCYTQLAIRKRRNCIEKCTGCGETKRIRAVGMCSRCYQKSKDGPIVKCKECQEEKEHHARGMCLSCYSKWSERTKAKRNSRIECQICKNRRVHHAKGICSKCYRRLHKKDWSKPIVVCQRCGKESEHMAKGLCTSCYYYENNGRKYNHIRNSRENGVPATLTSEEWDDILRDADYSCIYCGETENITQDHWLPLSRGGGYTAENIVPACKSCNSRKHTMTGEEYIDLLKREREYVKQNQG